MAPEPIPDDAPDAAIESLKRILGLRPHPAEGGFFAETYRSEIRLPARDGDAEGSRSLSTAIYYLITPTMFSAMHRLRGDEVFHFYLGDPVEMLLLLPGGLSRRIVLGTQLEAGMRPQVLVRGGTWQGSRLVPGGRFALLGTTMAPGFDPADCEAGELGTLLAGWPSEASSIRRLLRTA